MAFGTSRRQVPSHDSQNVIYATGSRAIPVHLYTGMSDTHAHEKWIHACVCNTVGLFVCAHYPPNTWRAQYEAKRVSLRSSSAPVSTLAHPPGNPLWRMRPGVCVEDVRELLARVGCPEAVLVIDIVRPATQTLQHMNELVI